ncbi:MAG TPA: GNAT family N-acetyltransferase [Nitrososphaerales archaeon]|nr:GNAT family N-acetyltransferase [Nitrososphaerales archaeon]
MRKKGSKEIRKTHYRNFDHTFSLVKAKNSPWGSFFDLKSGQFYKQFVAENGKTIILRSLKWEDLNNAVAYVNALAIESEQDQDFGVPVEKQTLESEARWLADNLVKIEEGYLVSVVAELDGMIVGSTEVERGSRPVAKYHGILGISVAKEFRNLGIGFELMKTGIDECRKAGLRTIELRVFSNNSRAIHLYEKIGFNRAGVIPKKIHRNGKFLDEVTMAIEL